MSQRIIADTVSKELGLSLRTGRKFLRRALELICDDIVYTERMELRHLGVFHVTTRPHQTISHPVTGELIYVPRKKVSYFRTSKVLRERLNPED
ncbi:HU family DNA-binding protein [bacterium]|nr:HU family DNA-binding protein [bacterium]